GDVFRKTIRLCLADAEYLGTAAGAFTPNCRPLVLEYCCLRVLDFYFLSAFHTISLGHLWDLL
ncbi:MAG: hypothetical protein KAS19_09255, partial [Anaerolineales bacterium]|nr:hypothetical protein [Anaerolineales bacterium]